jgi:hypothetical protein
MRGVRAAIVLALGLAAASCGRYGPPVRQPLTPVAPPPAASSTGAAPGARAGAAPAAAPTPPGGVVRGPGTGQDETQLSPEDDRKQP